MKLTRLASSALALALLGGTGAALAQYGPPPPPPGPQYGYRGWDAPPPEFGEYQRKGYLDGITGAERDYQNHRFVDVRNRDEYRHPHVPVPFRQDYRDGFRRGYYNTARHYQPTFVIPGE